MEAVIPTLVILIVLSLWSMVGGFVMVLINIDEQFLPTVSNVMLGCLFWPALLMMFLFSKVLAFIEEL